MRSSVLALLMAVTMVGCSELQGPVGGDVGTGSSELAAKPGGSTGFSARELGTLSGDRFSAAFGINAHGQVTGVSSGRSGTRAFFWEAGTMTSLGSGFAYDLSDGAAVIGHSDARRALVWERAAGSWSRVELPALEVPEQSGQFNDDAVGVNGAGTFVVGQSSPDLGRTAGGTPIVGQVPALWTRGPSGWSDAQIDTLPTFDGSGLAWDVNDAGEVVGSLPLGGTSQPVIWTGSPGNYVLESLPLLPGGTEGYAMAVNDSGLVAGFSTDASGERMGVLWRRAGAGWMLQQISRDEVLGLGDSGIAAGELSGNTQAAWLWTAAKGLLSLGQGAARDANGAGQVVGENGRNRAMLWTLTN